MNKETLFIAFFVFFFSVAPLYLFESHKEEKKKTDQKKEKSLSQKLNERNPFDHIGPGVWEKIDVKLTAYNGMAPCCVGEYADGKTAIGRDATKNDGVAVDPEKIPYMSVVYIPSAPENKFRIVDDTGSAMRNYEGVQIDIRMESVKKAKEFGVKYDEVYVLPLIK